MFNTSYDAEEQRFKAGEFYHIKHDVPYYEAIFHSKLADGLRNLGYAIENKPFSFEVAGVGQTNIDRFSRRTREIESLAEELGIADNAKAKDKLAATTRSAKIQGVSKESMIAEWQSRLDHSALTYGQTMPPGHPPKTAEDTAQLAIADAFERKSVTPYRRIIAAALQHSLGEQTVEAIEPARAARADLVVHTRRSTQSSTVSVITSPGGNGSLGHWPEQHKPPCVRSIARSMARSWIPA